MSEPAVRAVNEKHVEEAQKVMAMSNGKAKSKIASCLSKGKSGPSPGKGKQTATEAIAPLFEGNGKENAANAITHTWNFRPLPALRKEL